MMSRGLPYSIFLHVLGTVLIVMFGNHVARNPIQPARSISVDLVRMPPVQPPSNPVVEQESQPVQPVVQEEIQPDMPAKEIPEPKVVEEKEEPKQESKIEVAEPVVEETSAPVEDPVAQPILTTPNIAGTDSDFPFAWYLSLIESKIVSNWKPRQLGFGKRAIVSCTVHFSIAKNGTVSQVSLVRNSGVGVYDRESLRAVKTTRLPPLPPQYSGNSLGVTFIFNLEPGS